MASIAEPKADCCVIDVSGSWLTSVEKKLQTAVTRRRCKKDLPPTIFKVPAHIRENDESAYEPKLVALGPYHRRKKKLQAMEQCKWEHLHEFLGRNPGRRLDDYLREMKESEPSARGHYSERVRMSSDEFAEMLLLDGAFLVQVLLVVFHGKRDQSDPVTTTDWLLARVVYDMLLLENQIPFFVLKNLYDSVKASEHPLVTLALNLFRTFITTMEIPVGRHPANPIHHLLHLFYECILPLPDQPNPSPGIDNRLVHHRTVQGKPSIVALEYIPHAQQLHEAGIKFRRKDHYSPLEVTFGDGVVEMSRLCIYDHTSPLFRNLLAFEQRYKMSGTHVTNFAIFMDCLVDMAVLQREGVVMNGLGSQEEAADLFNRICKDIVANPQESYLKELFMHVNWHCNCRWPRWRAKLARDYFSNPWAIISLVAAVILLLFTFAQTFFAVLPYVVSKPE